MFIAPWFDRLSLTGEYCKALRAFRKLKYEIIIIITFQLTIFTLLSTRRFLFFFEFFFLFFLWLFKTFLIIFQHDNI